MALSDIAGSQLHREGRAKPQKREKSQGKIVFYLAYIATSMLQADPTSRKTNFINNWHQIGQLIRTALSADASKMTIRTGLLGLSAHTPEVVKLYKI